MSQENVSYPQTLMNSAFQLLEEVIDGRGFEGSDENPLKQLDMRLKAATTLLGKLAMLEQKAEEEDGIYLSRQDIEEMRTAMLRKLANLAETALIDQQNQKTPADTDISEPVDRC